MVLHKALRARAHTHTHTHNFGFVRLASSVSGRTGIKYDFSNAPSLADTRRSPERGDRLEHSRRREDCASIFDNGGAMAAAG